MAESKPARGPVDPLVANVHEAQDLKYWCRALGVPAERMVLAVEEAGTMADDIRAEPRRQRR